MAYTQADLQSSINRGIQGKSGLLIDIQDTMNEVVRELKTEVRLRSSKRSAALIPNLLSGIGQYFCPADLEGRGIVDVPSQAKRYDGEFNLVPYEQFSRAAKRGDIAIHDADRIRSLWIRSVTPDESVTIDPLSSLSPGTGTWATFGDAINLAANSDDYVKGSASLEFDINGSAGTMAGIVLAAGATEDLSGYIGHSAIFPVNARVTSPTGITNYKLRLGTNSSNYFEFTVTTRLDGTAFLAGWNPLGFSGTSYTTTGTPDATDVTYRVLFMTKSTSKINEAGYMFNYLQARKGKYANVDYYSTYGWLDSVTGAYKANSISPLDILIADEDEFDLFVKKGRVLANAEADIPVGISRTGKIINPLNDRYESAKANYQQLNPDDTKLTITSYHDYGSRGGPYNDGGYGYGSNNGGTVIY